MADDKITVGLELQDDLTPKIGQVKTALEGLGKTAGEGAGGGFMGEQMKELTAGIGYQFGLWNVGFMAAQKLSDAMGELIQDTQVYGQMAARMVGVNESAAGSFTELAAAALFSGTSISETWKRANELMLVGLTQSQAIQQAMAIQQLSLRTGVDITEPVKAAQMLRLTPEGALKMAQAPEFARLGPEARAAQEEEAMRPYREQALRHQQTIDQRLFQEKVHNIERITNLENTRLSQEMADRQRVENQAMEDAHYRISTEVEETNRAINREMELRHIAAAQAMEDSHRAISQEMEDRHRMLGQQMEDQDRLHSRQIGISAGIRGVTEAAFRETVRGGSAGGGPMGTAIDRIAAEMEAGYKQLEKDMGISRRQAQQLIASGAMSPQVLLQEAQAAREEERIQERRAMELESIMIERREQLETINQERRFQKEAFDERVRQEDQIHQMQVAFHNQEVAQSRQHEADQIEFERRIAARRVQQQEDIYQEQLRMTQRYEDKLESMESDRLASQLKRSLDAIDAEEAYTKDATDRMVSYLEMSLGQAGGFRREAGAAPERGGATEATAQSTNVILANLADMLSRILS